MIELGDHSLHVWIWSMESSRQDTEKVALLTCPTPVRRDAPFRERGRNEYRAQEVQAALRVGRSPVERVLAIGEIPPILLISIIYSVR